MLLAAFIGMVLAAAAQSPAHAQSPPLPHDLSLTFRHGLLGTEGQTWIFTLTNEGQQHAHSGQVQVSFTPYRGGTVSVDLARHQLDIGLDPEFGHFDGATRIWHFRNLAPGQTTELKLSAVFMDRRTRSGKERLIIGSAEIVSSVPREGPEYLHNNATREAWKYRRSAARSDAAEGNATVDLQVSNRFPEANDTVDFTVRFQNKRGYIGSLYQYHDMYDVRVKLTPSPGLTIMSAAAPSGAFGSGDDEIQISSSFRRSTGIWNIGSVPQQRSVTYIEMPVTVRYTGGSLEEACLTAEVDNVLPPERPDEPHIQRDSKVRVCLGEAPTALLREGEHPLLNIFPCVGETAYPCNDQDTVELVVPITREDILEQGIGIDRHDGIVPGEGLLTAFVRPDDMAIQVEDTAGTRKDATTPAWRSGSTSVGHNQAGTIPGVVALLVLPSPDYTAYTFAISAVGTLPGSMKIIQARNTGRTVLDVDNQPTWGPINTTSTGLPTVFEFGDLGTYVADITLGATHKATSTTDTDTGRYTFHVGPVADLEVRDAGASPELSTGQRAYSLVALNHGPDTPPDVQVTLTGVPEGAEAIVSQGSYTPGDCEDGLCQGVWDVGELISGVSRFSGRWAHPVLTLVTEDANAPDITAAIENIQDYCVRIKTGAIEPANDRECRGTLPSGYTEHTAAYYDYINDNNEATVEVRAGAGHPDAPRSLRADKFDSLVLLRWEPPTSGLVNRFGITHYQVERNGVILADSVTGTMYADLQGGAVNQAYRVRAVNDQGIPGPWSLPVGAGGLVEQPGELDAPSGLTATAGAGEGRIDLSWFAPSDETGLRYRIEHATDGAGPWTTLAGSHSGTTYSHGGLLSGTTHYYRVRAEKGNVVSPWAYVQETTEIVGDGAVYVPGWPVNLRFTSVERTAVTLAWDPPPDNGGSEVTSYEYRVYGPCGDGSGAVCDIVAPRGVSGTSARITGAEPGRDIPVPGAGAERRWRRGLGPGHPEGRRPRDRRRRAGHPESLQPDGARGRRGHLPGEAEPVSDPADNGVHALESGQYRGRGPGQRIAAPAGQDSAAHRLRPLHPAGQLRRRPRMEGEGLRLERGRAHHGDGSGGRRLYARQVDHHSRPGDGAGGVPEQPGRLRA